MQDNLLIKIQNDIKEFIRKYNIAPNTIFINPDAYIEMQSYFFKNYCYLHPSIDDHQKNQTSIKYLGLKVVLNRNLDNDFKIALVME